MIAAVGTREQLEKEAGDAEVIDLKGKVMLPGFIDPHSHFTQVASGLMQADLDGADSTEEIAHRLNQFVQEHQLKDGAWVIAKNYDTNLMPQQKNPGIAELDQFLGDRPLVIQQKSGHMGLFNSAAMKYLGITMDTPDPQGGRIGREDVPAHTIFVITTDGMENASHHYTGQAVREMIKAQKEKGWEFLFLAANIDAVGTAQNFGIDEDRAVNYRCDSEGTDLNFMVMSETISEVRKGKGVSKEWKRKIDEDYASRKNQ